MSIPWLSKSVVIMIGRYSGRDDSFVFAFANEERAFLRSALDVYFVKAWICWEQEGRKLEIR